MADNISNDPYTRAFDAIQTALASFPPLAALVKPGNRINQRVVNQVPRKDSEEDGDWPEQILTLTATRTNLFHANSQHCKFAANYSLQIASGVVTVEIVARVWWEVARAIYAYDPSGRLQLPDIVTDCEFVGSAPVKLTPYQGTDQFVTIGSFGVNFGMARSRLVTYPSQNFNT